MQDVLGHTLSAGTKILTAHYQSTGFEVVTHITKVTRVAAYVELESTRWKGEGQGWVSETRLVRRRPDQMLAIEAQQKYNQENFPENLI